MLIEVYLFLATFGFIFSILAILKREVVLFGWLGFILFSVLALTSVKLETPFCEWDTEWKCTYSNYSDYALVYLFGSLAVLMSLYSILNTFVWARERIREVE